MPFTNPTRHPISALDGCPDRCRHPKSRSLTSTFQAASGQLSLRGPATHPQCRPPNAALTGARALTAAALTEDPVRCRRLSRQPSARQAPVPHPTPLADPRRPLSSPPHSSAPAAALQTAGPAASGVQRPLPGILRPSAAPKTSASPISTDRPRAAPNTAATGGTRAGVTTGPQGHRGRPRAAPAPSRWGRATERLPADRAELHFPECRSPQNYISQRALRRASP